MAEIVNAKSNKKAPRIDFTPMVDLGFLLITFFIFTTTLSEPRNLELQMPAEGFPPSEVPHHTAMTILIGKDHRLHYFSGTDAMEERFEYLQTTGFQRNGIRQVLLQHADNVHRSVEQHIDGSRQTDFPFVIIKAGKQADYSDLVNLLDELMITHIEHYALTDMSAKEEFAIQKRI